MNSEVPIFPDEPFQEHQLQLIALKERMLSKLRLMIMSPIDSDEIRSISSHDVKWVEDELINPTMNCFIISIEELCKLSNEALMNLTDYFEVIIPETGIPSENIFLHELRHVMPLLENSKNVSGTYLVISIVRDEESEGLGIHGVVALGHQVNPRIRAMMASNPMNLSYSDVKVALTQARKTKDKEFYIEIRNSVFAKRSDLTWMGNILAYSFIE